MSRPSKPRLETLEERQVLSVFGNPWPNANRLTISFAPDGAGVAGYSQSVLGQDYVNSLFSELSSVGSVDAWKMEILRAYQTWAVHANINLGVVSDTGRAFGLPQLAPNTPESGVLRLGAYPQSPEVLAINNPYTILTGEWAGDVFLNSDHNFSIGGAYGTYDLFTVLLNEAGNVFGLQDVNQNGAALYGSYEGVKTGLLASDITALQSLYGGPRSADAHEGYLGNGMFWTATALALSTSTADPTKYLASVTADITTMSDVDVYSLQTRSDTTSAYVSLQTAGWSLFTGKVTVYNAQGVPLATATSAGPLGGDLTLLVENLQPSSTYFVRVEKGRGDVFGIGGYELKVGLGVNPDSSPVTTTTQVLGADDGTNDSIETATGLTTTPGAAPNSYYQAFANVAGHQDRDYYRLQAPANASILSVIVQPPLRDQLFAQVRVYDSNHHPVATDVLVDGDGGRYVVQVENVAPGSEYFVEVYPVGRMGNYLSGDYYLTANFREPRVQLASLRQGTLTQERLKEHVTMTISESQVVQFNMSAVTADASVSSGVRMILFNQDGQAIFTTTALPGRAGSGTLVLQAGTYTVRYEAATQNGEALPELTYTMSYKRVSDPIDPFPTDVGTFPPPPPPDPVVITYTDLYYSGLNLTDPWTDPWQF